MADAISIGDRRAYKELATLLARKRRVENIASDLMTSGKLKSAFESMSRRIKQEGWELANRISEDFPGVQRHILETICINAVRRAEFISEVRNSAPDLVAQLYKVDLSKPFPEQLARKELNEHLGAQRQGRPQPTP